MRRKISKGLSILLVLVVMIAMTSCGGTDYKVESTYSMADDVQSFLDKVDTEYGYDLAYTLAYDEKYLSNSLGFRTAGSDAEHVAADYLEKQMKEIGLENVEKVPVQVDKWQFNDASLTMDGTEIDIMPASYATNGTSKEGITAELVDVGAGQAADYEGKDVKDKIVLAGIDQWNEAWIDMYMQEAKQHGAAAIITYDTGGYATISDDVINMQDLCCGDLMPCVSISKKNYKEIAKALKEGNKTATLKVDNVVEKNKGTSYNVVGKIKGKSSEQQIIFAGHYDVYFNGFQDDSMAVGLVMTVAKAMKESGYVPENDIMFVCHGSEEWGALDTQYDWTTGAWEMINTAHPEWAKKTLALFNFELPAFYDNAKKAQISCVPEFASLTKDFAENSNLAAVNEIYPEGLDSASVDTNCMEDGVSYRAAGVPYFVDMPGTQDGEKGWIQQRYHTSSDDSDTYSEEVFATNINLYGALSIYVDKTPALELDITKTCDDLEEAINADDIKAAGGDLETYRSALADMRTAAEERNAAIADINKKYEIAAKEGNDKEIDRLREEGTALNKETLKIFKDIQDGLIGNTLGSGLVIKHTNYQNNIDLLNGIISALNKGVIANDKDGALDLAWQLNGSTEYGFYSFSPKTAILERMSSSEKYNEGNMFWNTNKGFEYTWDTYKALPGLFTKVEVTDKTPDLTEEISIYSSALKEQQEYLKNELEKEIRVMKKITEEM